MKLVLDRPDSPPESGPDFACEYFRGFLPTNLVDDMCQLILRLPDIDPDTIWYWRHAHYALHLDRIQNDPYRLIEINCQGWGCYSVNYLIGRSHPWIGATVSALFEDLAQTIEAIDFAVKNCTLDTTHLARPLEEQ